MVEAVPTLRVVDIVVAADFHARSPARTLFGWIQLAVLDLGSLAVVPVAVVETEGGYICLRVDGEGAGRVFEVDCLRCPGVRKEVEQEKPS